MMIRIGSYLEAKSINQSTEPRGVLGPTDTNEQYCSEEVLYGVYFFQVLACEFGVAWCG